MKTVKKYREDNQYKFLAHFSGGGGACPHLFKHDNGDYMFWDPAKKKDNKIVFTASEFEDLKNYFQK